MQAREAGQNGNEKAGRRCIHDRVTRTLPEAASLPRNFYKRLSLSFVFHDIEHHLTFNSLRFGLIIMCFSCSGWPWGQAVHLAAPPAKEEHIFLESSYDFYPDRRTVSEESSSAPALLFWVSATCHCSYISPLKHCSPPPLPHLSTSIINISHCELDHQPSDRSRLLHHVRAILRLHAESASQERPQPKLAL